MIIPMPLDLTRYPDNWTDLALKVKEAAGWKCQYCGKKCYEPGKKPKELTRSEWTVNILQVHHRNHRPEDNRKENLIATCTSCHLAMHRRRNGNASPGQLSLW
jgi:5-methylcytosine-specific restriction endonuclease McrA